MAEVKNSARGSLPILKIKGTHWEIGYEIGKLMSAEIHRYVKENPYLHERLLPFIETAEGANIYKTFLDTVKSNYPLYLQEVEGTAKGAGVDVKHLFLLQIEPELIVILGDNVVTKKGNRSRGDNTQHQKSSGCTNLYIKNPETKTHLLAHSEDYPPACNDACIWLNVTVCDPTDRNVIIENFHAFTIAGTLPGGLYSITTKDLMYACNNVYQKEINLQGIPRRFLLRSCLKAKSFEEIKTITGTHPGIATGYNLDVIHRENGQYVCSSIEMAGSSNGGIQDVAECPNFYSHVNRFDRINVPHYTEESSHERRLTLARYMESERRITDIAGVLTFLSDQENSDFPVFRTGNAPDYLMTTSIVVFNVEKMEAVVYREKPNINKPVINININTMEYLDGKYLNKQ